MIFYPNLRNHSRSETRHGRQYEIVLLNPGADGERTLKLRSTTTRLDALHNENLVRWRVEQAADLHRTVAMLSFEDNIDQATFLLAYEKQLEMERERRKIEIGSAEVGTQVHQAIENWCLEAMKQDVTTPVLLSGDAEIAFNAWVKWANGVRLVPYGVEVLLWSDKSAGTADFLGEVEGHVVLADWKTGSTLYPEYDLQIAEYCRAYQHLCLNRELLWLPDGGPAPMVDFGLIVHLPKTAGRNAITRFRSHSEMSVDLNVFDAICMADDWLQHNALKKALSVGAY